MQKPPSLLFALLFCLSAWSQPADSSAMIFSTSFYIPTDNTVYYQLGDTRVPIRIMQYGNDRHILYLNLHDNEFTSVQAARLLLEQQGGTLVKLENNGQRMIRFRLRGKKFLVDPNRIFSREGIERSLRETRTYMPWAVDEIEKFGQRILDLIPGNISCVVALHNNFEGSFSIKNYLPGGDRSNDAQAVQFLDMNDPDDIALTTDEDIYRAMVAGRFNSILQDNTRVKRDGSLSVYCGARGIRYINIETEHGRLESYQRMLQVLLQYLEKE
ncbi:MAG: hypothetical protein IPQ08_05450 [Chitinophagaceae bacterium]|nr:hypothetical protein [Chitinophagaceae bacterium]